MSFRSTEQREKKNKTENINEYMKQYRLEKKEHLNNLERCKYYKKKGLNNNIIDQFGEYSGLVFKLKNQFKELIQLKPEFSELIIQEILKED